MEGHAVLLKHLMIDGECMFSAVGRGGRSKHPLCAEQNKVTKYVRTDKTRGECRTDRGVLFRYCVVGVNLQSVLRS